MSASQLLVSLAHALLAAGVTVHVLLNKRDAGSSVAWIGLAWLAPILGSVLYLLLGINRVRRRARSLGRPRSAPRANSDVALRRPDHLSPLERAVGTLSGRLAQSGNTVTLLQNGDEAYPRMLAAIDAAERSIALSSYIFRADATGGSFILALVRARHRGVAVRVLIDGIGGGYFLSPTYWKLRRADVPVARFLHSPLPWRMPFLNLRTHRKVLAIDGRIAFTGGLNIGAENLTRGRHESQSIPLGKLVFDTHFHIEGPVVAQLIEVFAHDWQFATGQKLAGEVWFPALETQGESIARVVTSGPDEDLEKIEFAILQAVGCAQKCIKVMTPYFLPDDRMITALALAALRGVTVDIVLPAHSNHPTVDWATRAQIGPLLVAGCRVWTHPAPFNHSKLMTVDGIWCLIGSANWDMRSFRLNFELDVEIYHSGLVSQIDALILAQQGSRVSTNMLDERPLAARLRDGAARLMVPYL